MWWQLALEDEADESRRWRNLLTSMLFISASISWLSVIRPCLLWFGFSARCQQHHWFNSTEIVYIVKVIMSSCIRYDWNKYWRGCCALPLDMSFNYDWWLCGCMHFQRFTVWGRGCLIHAVIIASISKILVYV